MHGDLLHLRRVDVARGEHAVHLAIARRGSGGEARIAGERQFDCRRGELTADVGRVGVAHDAVQQRAGGLLGVGVGVVGARKRPLQLGRFDGQAGFQLSPHQIGLGVDVQTRQHERHRVAETADAVQRDLECRWWRLALARRSMRTRSVPSAETSKLSIRTRHIGIGVARTGDLVEQLGGDGVDGDQRRRSRRAW